MNNDQIIRLAQEAGLPTTVGWIDGIMQFASAVAAVEREACIECTDSECQCAWVIRARGAGMKDDQLTSDVAMMARNAIDYIIKLERQRAELLEALKVVIDDLMYKDHARVIDVARAAIAAAEGEKA